MRIKTAALVLLFAQLLSGCAGIMPGQITQEPRDDAIIATRIKAQLIEAKDLDAAAINVESDQGMVTLSGFVETDAQKQQAATLAGDVSGNRRVINNIEVN
jgi:osmotically-inducible protein OsmY